MTTQKEKIAFARRFSHDDWLVLSGNMDFLDALDDSLALAEVVAWRILNPEVM